MLKIELLIISVCIVWSAVIAFDFITYAIKAGAKSAVLSRWSWRMGLLTSSILMYWLMNGQSF